MISVQRQKGWEQRLFRYTVFVMSKPFEWGQHDCALFAGDCIEAMTGENPGDVYRGTYRDALGAARIIAEAGCTSLGDFAALMLPEVPVAFAQRGDLLLCEGPEGDFIAVCQGVSAVGPTPRGLIHVKTLQAKRAFKV